MEKNENSKYQEKNLYSINIIQSKQYITFSINSGKYNAAFYENCNYDKECLKMLFEEVFLRGFYL